MGYAFYDTPHGQAGYGVDDICHADGCDEEIDRGLGYLCGNQPGIDDGIGCGWWFCDGHLYLPPPRTDLPGVSLCTACWDRAVAWRDRTPDAPALDGAISD